MENTIIQKVKHLDLGNSLNRIQDVAEKVLTPRKWVRYVAKSHKDYVACEGMDGILLNGEYFDWKEFTYNKDNIVKAYLRYFDENDIRLIAKAM